MPRICGGKIAYHDFEGHHGASDEGARISPAGDKPVLLLRNHGPVAIGQTLPMAFSYMWVLQPREVQLASSQPSASCARSRSRCWRNASATRRTSDPKYGAGALFAALQRLVDRIDPGIGRSGERHAASAIRRSCGRLATASAPRGWRAAERFGPHHRNFSATAVQRTIETRAVFGGESPV